VFLLPSTMYLSIQQWAVLTVMTINHLSTVAQLTT
jgi:hypothetical protein